MKLTNNELALQRLDPSQFIDFSTAPYRLGTEAEPYLITDVSATISRYITYPSMQTFYRRFPLHEIIGHLLSQSIRATEQPDVSNEHMAFVTEEKLGNFIDKIDMDHLFVFYDTLVQELEEEITIKSPSYIRSGDYVFYRWIDNHSLCLCLESISEHGPFIRLGS